MSVRQVSVSDHITPIMGSTFMDLESLATDLGRLEMDRDSSDLVFVVGRDEAKVSGHTAIFSVRCTKFVDLLSNNNTNITSSHSQVRQEAAVLE